MNPVSLVPIEGIPEVEPGDDLGRLIADRATLQNRDVVVVAHKVVSKAEGRIVETNDRGTIATRESARVLRRRGDMVISETRHGFVCANAGVDASNVSGERVVMLPLDPDLSARRLKAQLLQLTGAEVGIVVSDTFGRPWRVGQTNVAIGVAGFDAFVDYTGSSDAFGKELVATSICVADELAAAAELVMGKTSGICAVIVRGAQVNWGRGAARTIVRPPGEDLFR